MHIMADRHDFDRLRGFDYRRALDRQTDGQLSHNGLEVKSKA